jgi:HK97 family phage prohead protease
MTLDAELAKLTEIVGAVDVPFESKSLDIEGDGTLILKGLAAGFGPDRFGESFDRGTFEAAFSKYMATNPIVTLNHKLDKVLGRITSARFTQRGVEVEAEIPKPDPGLPELMNAYQLIKSKVLKAFSVGGRWKRVPRELGGTDKVYPVEIVETTIAGVPVDASALFEVAAVKALGGNLDDELTRLTDLTTGSSSPLDDALERLAGL